MDITITGPLEATPAISQVHSLPSVYIATPGSLQVVHRFTPGGHQPKPSLNLFALSLPIIFLINKRLSQTEIAFTTQQNALTDNIIAQTKKLKVFCKLEKLTLI